MALYCVHFKLTQNRQYLVEAESFSEAENKGIYALRTDDKVSVESYSLEAVEYFEDTPV
jgi:hypothetical protein